MQASLVAVCVAIAICKVLIGALSLPFFTHLDEVSHVDTLFKYARGQWPELGHEAYDRESLVLNHLYNSPEYTAPLPDPPPPTFASVPPEVRDRAVEEALRALGPVQNHQAWQPPIYYLIAGAWLNVGRALGMEGVQPLYWVRCLDALFYALMIVQCFRLFRLVAPERPFLWLGGPILLCAFPQDILCQINNDVPAGFLFPLALELLIRVERGNGRCPGMQVACGIALAACFLNKATNLTILVAAVAILFPAIRRARAASEPIVRRYLPLAFSAGLPVAAWFAYSLIATGDLTGTDYKVGILGFKPQTWDGLVAHPVFTVAGAWTFLFTFLSSFWRGDLFWNGELMRYVAVDAVYVATTLLFLAVSGGTSVARRAGAVPGNVAAACWGAFATAVIMLLGLSIAWDFGDNPYPSKDFPYFVSGRLVLGLVVPFLLIYLDGLERLTTRIGGSRLAWISLAVLVLVAAVSESLLISAVVRSPYNWWHLQY